MRILIVKLSSLGDVVHAMPVVHDLHAAFAGAKVDWVVEPGFAPLVRRVVGIGEVIECALRRWSGAWWTRGVWGEWRAFFARLRRERYDAVLDLQGLTKSAVVARLAHGMSHGLANRTEGASHEPPARWLVDRAIRIEPHVHAVDRSRRLAAAALGYALHGPPVFGLQARATPRAGAKPTLVFVHGSSRVDKLWPEANWIALGRRAAARGWHVVLPHAGAVELERAGRLRFAIGAEAAEVWPALALDALVDRLGATQGVIGVDSGLAHIAVALDLPHVQLYNFPTAWRTGPPAGGGRQVTVQAVGAVGAVPAVDVVWAAWLGVCEASSA